MNRRKGTVEDGASDHEHGRNSYVQRNREGALSLRSSSESFVPKSVILFLLFMSATAMLARIFSLQGKPPQAPLLVWLPYLVLVSISAIVALKMRGRFPILVILLMSTALNLVSSVRGWYYPPGFIVSVDEPHHMQISSQIAETGHLVFGYDGFTGEAYAFSFYPGLDMLMASLSILSGIQLSLVYNFAFSFLNGLVLMLFFAVVNRTGLDARTVNLCTFLYALCPKLHGFDSGGVSESLGIIFYPFLLGAFFFDKGTLGDRRRLMVFLVFAVAATVTHHFTMYMLSLQAIVVAAVVFLFLGERSRRTGRTLSLVLVLTGSWLLVVGSSVVNRLGVIPKVVESLWISLEGAPEVPRPYVLPAVERILSYLGIAALLLSSLFGVWIMRRRKLKLTNETKVALGVLWGIDASLLVLFEAISWHSPALIEVVDVRFRALSFIYPGIVMMSGVGVVSILGTKTRPLRFLAAIAVLLLIAVPTVTVGFQGWIYDNAPIRASDGLDVYPLESYASSVWISGHTTPGWISSTWQGYAYISGYAERQFSYVLFVESVEQREVLTRYYSFNRISLLLPDSGAFKLEPDDVRWLNTVSFRVYDNGGLATYSAPECTKSWSCP
jgi:hypothetical protein